MQYEPRKGVAAFHGWTKDSWEGKETGKQISALDSIGLSRLLIVAALWSEARVSTWQDPGQPTGLLAMAKRCDVDATKIRKVIAGEDKPKASAKPKPKPKAKPAAKKAKR